MNVQKPNVYFVLGGPGAGKGTQSQKLVDKLGWTHLSAGDLLRAERKSGSKNGDLIESFISQGSIVPSEITVRLLQNAMDLCGPNNTFLIDGFPRNKENYDQWDVLMHDRINFKRLLFFNCSEEVMAERIIKRSVGSGRSDDNTETLVKRFLVYQQETQPIIEFFQNNGQILILQADGSESDVFDRLIDQINQIQ